MPSDDISSTNPRARPPRRLRRRAGLALAGLTAAAAFLLLWRLDRPLLWQDEAEVANIAVNLLEPGFPRLPSSWDGEHLVAQMGGRASLRVGEEIIWSWHPWTQHYLAAAGLALTGRETDAARTTGARLPFALIGLLTVPLFYVWRLRREPWAAATAAAVIYTFSIGFVLYARQCRYYSLLLLGGLLTLWAYDAAVGRRGPGRAAGLGAALGLVFYANPLSAFALGGGIGLHSLVTARGGDRSRLRLALGAGAVLVLLAAPWLALMLASEARIPEMGVGGRLLLLAGQAWRFQYTFLPMVLWPVLLWVGWRTTRRLPEGAAPSGRTETELGLLTVLVPTMLVLVTILAPAASVRYLLPLWPLCAASLGRLWSAFHARSALAGAAFLVLLAGTDLFSSLPGLPVTLVRPAQTSYDRLAPTLDKMARNGRLSVPLASFLHRQLDSVRGPAAAIVRFTRSLNRPPRAIAAAYGWESLHYYLDVPVVGPSLQRSARRGLGLPQLDPEHIDLVIPRRGRPDPPVPEGRFVTVDLGVPDDPYENLPNPTRAQFAPSTLPSLRVRVREELLPETVGGIPPAAGTSTD